MDVTTVVRIALKIKERGDIRLGFKTCQTPVILDVTVNIATISQAAEVDAERVFRKTKNFPSKCQKRAFIHCDYAGGPLEF